MKSRLILINFLWYKKSSIFKLLQNISNLSEYYKNYLGVIHYFKVCDYSIYNKHFHQKYSFIIMIAHLPKLS
jgi:hypothetical protein